MKRLLIGLVTAAAAIVIPAHMAGATDGDLSFSQDCTSVYVTVVSHYADGVIHVQIDAPVNAGGDIPPLGSHTFPFGWNGATSYPVTVTSSNGHLNGQPPGTKFKNTFTKDGACTTPTTPVGTTPPTTTCEQAIPQRDDCGTTTVPVVTTVPNPCITAPQPGQPGYDACGDCSTPEQCPVTTPPKETTTAAPPAVSIVKQQGPPRTAPRVPLPATGNGETVLWAGVCVGIIGAVLVGTTLRGRRS